MSRTDAVIRTPGRPPTFVTAREEGGWIVGQGKNGSKNVIRLADDEARLVAAIFMEQQTTTTADVDHLNGQ